MDDHISNISATEPETQTPEFIYPPKPIIQLKENNLLLQSISSLSFYLIAGYFFFNQNWVLLLVLTVVVLFHEMGHFLAMKYYGYGDLGIFFIPLLGAFVSGTKQTISQKQSAIILMAGPLPGIVLGILLYFIATKNQFFFLEQISWMLVFLNLLNLLPIYPLDGGQLLNRVFMNDHNLVGKIFFLLSVILFSWFAIHFHFLPLLFFPAYMLYKMWGNFRYEKIIEKIETEGINLETSYDTISDTDYWKIRAALIKHHPDLKDIPSASEFVLDEKENKIVEVMQSVLQQTFIMDAGISYKIILLLIWIACFLIPFIYNFSFPFFN